MTRTFDHLNAPLAGTNLIEASAGTGKTYAIALLYVRLVLEQGLMPEQILVVTFTEAATRELRDRIRRRLREALDLFQGGETSDRLLQRLATAALAGEGGRERCLRRLTDALTCFDQAAIQTIHGFCLKALQENAFESGSLYDTELVTDQRPLLREVADDFWRRRFFGPEAPLLEYALACGHSADDYAAFLAATAGDTVQVLPVVTGEETARLDAEAAVCHGEISELWRRERDGLVAILRQHKGLRRTEKHYRADVIAGLPEAMDRFTAAASPWEGFAGFEKFTSGFMQAEAMSRTAPPEHPFFDLCQRHRELLDARLLALRSDLVAWGRAELPRRKRQRNVRCFDDLIGDLYRALERSGGEQLADRVRDGFQAALIDEFQDTDPAQYRIFHTIFAGSGRPLFFIGDPKQAIYGFRGADVFAYLEAASGVDPAGSHSLDYNWRTDHRLLAGVNALFSRLPDPFVFDRIGFHRVEAGKYRDGTPLVQEGDPLPPLRLWFTAGDGTPLASGAAERLLPAAVAGETARLLDDGQRGRALVEGRRLAPGDVAVIVRTHRQAALVQDALRAHGIPSVTQGSGNLFDSREAAELLAFLHAVADPADNRFIRGALLTDMLGASGDSVAALLEHEDRWDEVAARFHGYHDLWRQRGVMAMSLAAVDHEAVRGRLLSRPDGERRLTNLLHCLELLHQAEAEGRLGMEGLLVWLGRRISGGEERDEYQMRLETDAAAVKIVTVHVSKGLEYPVVFCPFAWQGLRPVRDPVPYHDTFRLVKDFGSPDLEEHRRLAQVESLAEEVRLLYVALTRAKFRCYLAWGHLKGAEQSPLAWLLHRAAGEEGDALARAAAGYKALGAADLEAQLRELAASCPEGIAVVPVPPPDGAPAYRADGDGGGELTCRSVGRVLDDSWRVASFTSFAAGHQRHAELPDRDEAPAAADAAAESPPPDPDGIAAFPRGARPGIFLHELFELLDFPTADGAAVTARVAEGLARHGYPERWRAGVSAMVERVLAVPLDEDGTATLRDLRPGDWVAELEFFFPLRFLESRRLAELFRAWSGQDLPSRPEALAGLVEFPAAAGYVRGFMDLVCRLAGRYYLVDWKSNHLGQTPAEYDRPRLEREMVRNLYPLQYLLYVVALDRHLALRVPGYDYDRDFGGVRYLFLRGIDPAGAPGCGVFADRPPRELVRQLSELLLATDGEAGHD